MTIYLKLVEKFLGQTVYIKRMDIDGLILIRECQVARISVNYNLWGNDYCEFYLDPDFGHCKNEDHWIVTNYENSIFLSKEECMNSIYKDIHFIKEENPELQKQPVTLHKV